MAVRSILRLGNPLLRQRATDVGDDCEAVALTELIADMVDTMRNADGVGLAAPQVGVPLRVFTVEVREGNPRYAGAAAIPLRVCVNPELELHVERDVCSLEGCLSIPDLRGLAMRHSAVTLRYLQEDLTTVVTEELTGFEAIIVQHELDHLDGIMYVDRLRSSKDLGFLSEFTETGLLE